jgi:hypothetical protein
MFHILQNFYNYEKLILLEYLFQDISVRGAAIASC